MKNTTVLYYIGDNFYMESSTIMSPIYHENGARSDWGKVQIMLAEGKDVHIRQATDAEMLKAYKQLDELKSRQSARRA